ADVLAGGILVGAERMGQWQPKNAEPIGHSDTQVNSQGRRRYQPAIEPWSGNRAGSIKQTAGIVSAARRSSRCAHGIFPAVEDVTKSNKMAVAIERGHLLYYTAQWLVTIQSGHRSCRQHK